MKTDEVIDPRQPKTQDDEAELEKRILKTIAFSNREIAELLKTQNKLIRTCRTAACIWIVISLGCVVFLTGLYVGYWDSSVLTFIEQR